MYELVRLEFLNAIPVVGKVYDIQTSGLTLVLIDKAPIFGQVIQDWDAKMSTNPKNEQFS